MYSKAKYHLYESAHSGLLPDQSVNLLPKTWTTRTITDGIWMTDNTLSALNWRDYFLANMIDTVDEDKRNHYIAGNAIAINHEEKTISFVPNESNYEFDENSGMFFEPQNECVYTKLPNEVEGQENKIKIIDGYLNYDLTPGDLSHSAEEIYYPDYITSADGIIEDEGTITSFPENCNVVFVSQSKLDTNTTWSSDFIKNGYDDYYSTTDNTRHQQVYEDVLITSVSGGNIDSSANIFNPTDTTPYTGGFNGGRNYITDDVNMVPTGILFIW